MKKEKVAVGYDWRGVTLREKDTVVVRESFPYSSHLTIGTVEKIRTNKNGSCEVKLLKGKWYINPLKLANK